MVAGATMQPCCQCKQDAAELSVQDCCQIQQSNQQVLEIADGDDDDGSSDDAKD